MMNRAKNEHPQWTDRLSGFMAGDLEPDQHAEVEEHLSECGTCRRVLEELREVAARAAALGPVEPSRDLWDGIAATIEAPVPDEAAGARVIELPTADAARRRTSVGDDASAADRRSRPSASFEAGRASGRTSRRFSLSTGQLAAASVALVAMSSWVTWAAGTGDSRVTDPRIDASSASGVIQPAAQVAEPPPGLARELASLEQALAAARGVLDPNTVRVLEHNLGIIEQAIEDSQRALAQDPENDFLLEHLQRVYERKLEYLRDVARVTEQAE